MASNPARAHEPALALGCHPDRVVGVESRGRAAGAAAVDPRRFFRCFGAALDDEGGRAGHVGVHRQYRRLALLDALLPCRADGFQLDPVGQSSLLSNDNYFYQLCLQGRYSKKSVP